MEAFESFALVWVKHNRQFLPLGFNSARIITTTHPVANYVFFIRVVSLKKLHVIVEALFVFLQLKLVQN